MPVSKKKKHGSKKRKPNKPPNLPETLNRVINDDDQPEEMKLSNKVIQLIAPWLDTADDIPALVDMACIAWNACVEGRVKTESFDFLTNNSVRYEESDEVIEKLKSRKLEMFPNDYRTIVRTRIYYDEKGELKLIITSELKPKHMGKMLTNLIENSKSEDATT